MSESHEDSQKENGTPPESSEEILKRELRECQDKCLRIMAESENSRKRMQKEKQELTKYAVENIIAEFLHPLDSFEKALRFAESSSGEVKNWAYGFEMILGQFKQVLSNHGVQAFEALGAHFNPHLHEAVEVVETVEHPSGTVLQEFLRGYKIGDRIIRPARVKVSKTPNVPLEEENQDNQFKSE